MTELERFEAKIEKTDSCWLWKGWTKPNGYGGFNKHDYAHRVAWRLYKRGPLPPEVDHICGVRSCVNPNHLRGATRHQNGASIHVVRSASGYKGVSWHAKVGKWIAGIKVNQKRINLGYFDNPQDAARAYDAAAEEHFGEFAKTNSDLGRL